MAFKKRQKKIIENNKTSEQPKTQEQLILDNKKIKTQQEKLAESYLQQAITVLNILEEQGVNIYDENRFGGMYLRQNRSKVSRFVKKKKQTETTDIKKKQFLQKILNKK